MSSVNKCNLEVAALRLRKKQSATTVAAPPACAGGGRLRLLRLLRTASAAIQNGLHHQGLAAADAVVQQTEDGSYPRLRVEAQALQALHRLRLGMLADAIPAGLEAASRLDYVKDAAARAEVLCTVAIACNELGLTHDGLKYALEALAAARISNDPTMLSWALNRAGLCTYCGVGDLDQGVALLRQALALAIEHAQPIAEFSALTNLGSIYRRAGIHARDLGQTQVDDWLAQSLDYYRQAERLPLLADNLFFRSAALLNMAEILTETGRYDEALLQLQQGRQLAKSGDFLALEQQACMIEAVAFHRGGQLQAAIEVLQALLAQPQLDYEMMVLGNEELYRLFKEVGAFEQALCQLEQLRKQEKLLAEKRSSTQGWALRKELEIASARLETERERLNAEHERLRAVRLESEKSVAEARMSELEQVVMIDSLTSVGNRRCLDQEGPLRMSRLHGGFDGMALVVVDLDFFKSINDRFGHSVGDDTLRKVAQLMVLHTRSVDLVVRYGGEEFVLLLMEATQEAAIAACERLRLAVMDYDWSSIHPLLHVTCSLGMVWQSQPQPWPVALKAADRALYQAKHHGRNRLELATY